MHRQRRAVHWCGRAYHHVLRAHVARTHAAEKIGKSYSRGLLPVRDVDALLSLVTIAVGEMNTTVTVEIGMMTALDRIDEIPGIVTLARGGRTMIGHVVTGIRKGIASRGLETARGIDIGKGIETNIDAVPSGMNEAIGGLRDGIATTTVIVVEYGVMKFACLFHAQGVADLCTMLSIYATTVNLNTSTLMRCIVTMMNCSLCLWLHLTFQTRLASSHCPLP